ncbi:MAG: RHS repeat-associated core domain-containing protein [Flavobacteriales bacterium]
MANLCICLILVTSPMNRHSTQYQSTNPFQPFSDVYRYGFNGKEKDAEGMGGGSSTYDYGFRIYNAGLGRFLSTDPLSKEYPWYTPYQFAGNKPIWCIDIDGAEELIVTIRQDPNTPQLRKITITKVSESTRVSDPNFGTMGVQYVLQDAQGVVTSSQRMPDLQPGSAEEYAMNRTKLFYGTQGGNLNGETPTTMTQREALNPTPNGSGKGAAADCCFNESRNEKESNQLVGVVIYDFKLDIQFNTDKAGITIEDLQPGTYDLAIDDLNSLTQILQNDSRFARRTVVCIGSTDIRPSRYKAPDGRVCGNPCLAEDRANSVANFIRSEVSQIVLTTTAVSTSTEVVDSDRRTTVVLDAN